VTARFNCSKSPNDLTRSKETARKAIGMYV
jgi:hypothetical protein